MPAYSAGQRVRVRPYHGGCSWCARVRGRVGVIVGIFPLDDDDDTVMYSLRLDADNGVPQMVLPLKEECLQAT